MRLIHTTSHVLVEFVGGSIPPYAILSHTWAEEEVPFMRPGEPWPTTLKGYQKIAQSCRQARERWLDWVWIDCCCIDKSSGAELSESINSMYNWYQNAQVCFVYLDDLRPADRLEQGLRACKWFTRGWTLQELIAPANVLFFDTTWTLRGSKVQWATILSQITSIARRCASVTGYRHAKMLRSRTDLITFS